MQTTQELFESSTGGAPLYFNKQSPVGATVSGTVVESGPVQNRDYEDNTPKFWDDGSPQMMLVITLQTNLRDRAYEDDDGKRRIYVKWWGSEKQNLVGAIQKTGDKFLRDGATLTVTFTGLGEQKDRKLNPPRIYDFVYAAPPSATEAMMTKVTTNGTPPVQTTQPQEPLPEANDLVAQARAAQLARTQPAASAGAAPPAAPTPDAGGKMLLIKQVKELAAEGINPDIIAELVPGLSLNAITAILKV